MRSQHDVEANLNRLSRYAVDHDRRFGPDSHSHWDDGFMAGLRWVLGQEMPVVSNEFSQPYRADPEVGVTAHSQLCVDEEGSVCCVCGLEP